ncbi:MAG: hypothetical protein ACFFC0_08180 [Promethearchaeota archaeon]
MDEQVPDLPCTWLDESVCLDCSLADELNCRHDSESLACFRQRHLGYRALAFLVVGVASFVTGLWWMFLIYAIVTVLNFTVIESWYLCRHCPFYSRDGRTLQCITLQGMPRLWKFDPSPITRSEQLIMTAVGGFIDLFPLLAGAYGSWVAFSTDAGITTIAIMIVLTLVMLAVAGYFGKYLADNYCVRCVNFSCVMNKTSKPLVDEYLLKNPAMREAWEACGYVLGVE